MAYTREEWAVLSEDERGPCVETRNSRNVWGYGRCWVRRHGKMIYLTHVLAWVDATGQLPPPETPKVLHHCDNPPCARVDHLWVGTQAENVADAVSKERHAHMSACPKCGGPVETFVSTNGKYRRCPTCYRLRQQNYYAENRETVLARQRRQRAGV